MRAIRKFGCVSSEGWHVQQEKGLPGQEVRSPVVWIAGWRETKTSEAYRQRLPRGDDEASPMWAVTTVNANVASKVRSPEGRVLNRRGEGRHGGAEI